MDKKIKVALSALAFSACLFIVSCNEEEKKAEEAPKTEEAAPAPTPEPAPAPAADAQAAPADGMDSGSTRPVETNVRK